MESMRKTIKLRSRTSPEKKRPSFFWLLAAGILPAWNVMTRYRFTPESRLPKTGAFILAPNHFSEIDPITMGVAVWRLGRLPRFMAKASLFRVPILGWIMRSSGQIPVERSGNPRRSDLRSPIGAANEIAARRAGVIVYPEGTLTRDPDLWPMRGKSGAIRLALEAGVPLYPVAHWGSQRLMPRYARGIRPFPPKTIHVSVGEPLDLSKFEGKPITQHLVSQATELLMTEITRLLAELREDAPPETRWNPTEHDQSETGRF
jgi:1-acyl-sn-glycerol-3-phosphate acyltransferase